MLPIIIPNNSSFTTSSFNFSKEEIAVVKFDAAFALMETSHSLPFLLTAADRGRRLPLLYVHVVHQLSFV
jgi:hypothetical protein